jgi:hypothetical protein
MLNTPNTTGLLCLKSIKRSSVVGVSAVLQITLGTDLNIFKNSSLTSMVDLD